MRRITLICLLLLIGAGSAAHANEDDWRLDKDKEGIKIYTRAVEGSGFRAIRAVTHVDGRMSSIIALLQDMSYWPKLNKVISSASVHEQLNETESLVYLQLDMPWPVSDRDVLNRRQVFQDASTKVVTLTEVATIDVMPEKKDFVRIVESTQRWTLTPNPKGGIDVQWVTHTEPNGPLPAPLVNFLLVGGPYDSLTVLRAAIESGEFADAEHDYITEPGNDISDFDLKKGMHVAQPKVEPH